MIMKMQICRIRKAISGNTALVRTVINILPSFAGFHITSKASNFEFSKNIAANLQSIY